MTAYKGIGRLGDCDCADDFTCAEHSDLPLVLQTPRENSGECDNHWYFTFGCGQEHAGKYVVLFGTCQSTRDEMWKLFGEKWAFQYKTAEEAGVEKWSYKKLEVDKCSECGTWKIGDDLEWVEYPDEGGKEVVPDLRLVCGGCRKEKKE